MEVCPACNEPFDPEASTAVRCTTYCSRECERDATFSTGTDDWRDDVGGEA